MRPHQLSIPPLAWSAEEAGEPHPNPNFFRGIVFGLAFSLPLWALIAWVMKDIFF